MALSSRYLPTVKSARQLLTVQTDGVSVLSMELVHQALFRVVPVLRNLLDERFVVEAMDRFEFPILTRDFKR